MAVEKTFNKLIINGRRLNIKWGKSQASRSKDASEIITTVRHFFEKLSL